MWSLWWERGREGEGVVEEVEYHTYLNPVPTGLSINSRLASFSHVVSRGLRFTSSGPISIKLPNPVEDPPGPP